MSLGARPEATIAEMRSRPLAWIITVAAGTVAVSGGCTSTSRQSATTTTSAASKSFQVSTPLGQASLSLDGRLPPSWPQSFPVPSGATPAGSGSLTKGGSGTQVGVYTTDASGPDTFSFYTNHPGLTTSGAKAAGTGSSYVGAAKITDPYDGSITVVSHSGSTYIVAVLTGSSGTTTTTT